MRHSCSGGFANCAGRRGGVRIVVVALLLVVAAVALFFIFRKPKTQPAAPEKPWSAEDQTKAMIEERVNDKEYMAGLKKFELAQNELARRRNELLAEYRAWLKGFCESNDAARALVQRQAVTNSPSFMEDMDKLVAADPEGSVLVAKRDAIDGEIGELQGEIKAYIGDRIRRQATEGSAAEKAAAVAYQKEHPQKTPFVTNGVPVKPTEEWREEVRRRLASPQAKPDGDADNR